MLPTLSVVAYIEIVRAAGGQPAVPFLLLSAAVIVSAIGGRLTGLLAGVIAAAFVMYSARIGFGPPSLTGGGPQAYFGAALYLAIGFLLGRTRDDNALLMSALRQSRAELEETVARRTQQLRESNESLAAEIKEHQRLAQELETSQDLLQHSQRLRSIGMLAGGIAHDFNNLLTSIQANASLLRETSVRDPTQCLEEIDQACRSAAKLCDQMLFYAGKRQIAREAIDLRGLLHETVGFVRASASKNVRFEVRDGPEIHVMADRAQISQVILNLLTNAVEAIDGAGLIRCGVAVEQFDDKRIRNMLLGDDMAAGRHVCIDVQDDGAGMNAEQVAAIFDPFFTTKTTGRGLGLAVVLGAARAHGGGVGVRSAPKEGTTITFVLPDRTMTDRAPIPPQSRPVADGRAGTRAGTILVVDDEPGVRGVVSRVLASVGWSVVAAADGHEAIAALRAHDDVVLALVDMTMPGMDGIETCRALRELDESLPVVIMSGYSGRSEQAAELADSYLDKPFDAARLLGVVDVHIRETPPRATVT